MIWCDGIAKKAANPNYTLNIMWPGCICISSVNHLEKYVEIKKMFPAVLDWDCTNMVIVPSSLPSDWMYTYFIIDLLYLKKSFTVVEMFTSSKRERSQPSHASPFFQVCTHCFCESRVSMDKYVSDLWRCNTRRNGILGRNKKKNSKVRFNDCQNCFLSWQQSCCRCIEKRNGRIVN